MTKIIALLVLVLMIVGFGPHPVQTMHCWMPNTLDLEWDKYYLYNNDIVEVKHEGIEIRFTFNQDWENRSTHTVRTFEGEDVFDFRLKIKKYYFGDYRGLIETVSCEMLTKPES